ncbi:MAG TPA: hypothetical protein VL334_00555 [Anaerolineae bacterium]|nr:hypothetical protein [Anaerolineae bacterium]
MPNGPMSNVEVRPWQTTSASNCPATGAKMSPTPPQPQLSSRPSTPGAAPRMGRPSGVSGSA